MPVSLNSTLILSLYLQNFLRNSSITLSSLPFFSVPVFRISFLSFANIKIKSFIYIAVYFVFNLRMDKLANKLNINLKDVPMINIHCRYLALGKDGRTNIVWGTNWFWVPTKLSKNRICIFMYSFSTTLV